MAKGKAGDEPQPKRLAFLHGEIKSPPFSDEARKEAGEFLRLLQRGQFLGMPKAEPLPIVGSRCGALRIRDEQHNWRIMYRVDPAVVLVITVYDKKTEKIPNDVIALCKRRLKEYDTALAEETKKLKKNNK